jgi:hypothetical protein
MGGAAILEFRPCRFEDNVHDVLLSFN